MVLAVFGDLLLCGRPRQEGYLRAVGKPGNIVGVEQAALRQASTANNAEVVLKWLPRFAMNEPTQLETKLALMEVGVRPDCRLCPASMCKEEVEASQIPILDSGCVSGRSMLQAWALQEGNLCRALASWHLSNYGRSSSARWGVSLKPSDAWSG